MTIRLELNSDIYGAFASSLCLIHCIVTPLVFVIHPTTHFKNVPVWWQSLDLVFLIISLVAVFWSTTKTNNIVLKYSFWFCWIVLTAAILNEKLEGLHLGEWVVYLPAIGLIFLHFYSKKYDKQKA